MCTTGNGATVTFATYATVLRDVEIDLGEDTIESLDDSDLATADRMAFCPSDLADSGEVAGRFRNESEKAYPTIGAVDTMTATFPKDDDANAQARVISATGFWTRVKRPVLANGQLLEGEYTFKLDGKTFSDTPESAT